MDYDQLKAYLEEHDYWWVGRVYKSFTGLLDMHIQWSHSARIYHYVLVFDPLHVMVGEHYELWPTPRDFYLARQAIRTNNSWTIAEYDAYMTTEEGPIDDSEAVAMTPTPEPPTSPEPAMTPTAP